MNVVQDNDDVENRPFSIAIVDNDAIALYAFTYIDRENANDAHYLDSDNRSRSTDQMP